MNVLIIGSGAREHALAWKIARDPRVEKIHVAPGNAGTARDPRLQNLDIELKDVAAFAVETRVKLVVIGPEAPLVAGLADELRAHGIAVVGPGAAGALLEGSKAFAKEVMVAAGVPTARYAEVSSAQEIDAFVDSFDGQALVVKADGLAAGKGVVVCDDREQARQAAHEMLRDRPFGDASARIVLEERLHGIETSYIVLTDGTRFVALPTSQDHKRLLDGDEGPNTGGMGAFSPAPFVSDAMSRRIEAEVIEPTLAELRRRNIPFRGFLYAGVMLTENGPLVLEFNTRLGDPETQVLLSVIDDALFVDALLGAARGHLEVDSLGAQGAAAVVVLAAEGYPVAPKKGAVIHGLDQADAEPKVVVFHAGTRQEGDKVLVAGGRVLGVTATGATPEEAVERAYRAVDLIRWEGMQVRRDIGKALSN